MNKLWHFLHSELLLIEVDFEQNQKNNIITAKHLLRFPYTWSLFYIFKSVKHCPLFPKYNNKS